MTVLNSSSGIWKSALMLAVGYQRRDRVHFAFASLLDLVRNGQSTKLCEWYAKYGTSEPLSLCRVLILPPRDYGHLTYSGTPPKHLH